MPVVVEASKLGRTEHLYVKGHRQLTQIWGLRRKLHLKYKRKLQIGECRWTRERRLEERGMEAKKKETGHTQQPLLLKPFLEKCPQIVWSLRKLLQNPRLVFAHLET